jgi:hypothetical protein
MVDSECANRFDQAVRSVNCGKVDPDRISLPAVTSDLGDHRLGGLLVRAVMHDDVRPLFGETKRRGPPQPARSTGDEGNLTG